MEYAVIGTYTYLQFSSHLLVSPKPHVTISLIMYKLCPSGGQRGTASALRGDLLLQETPGSSSQGGPAR
jgi:hypothetical protein